MLIVENDTDKERCMSGTFIVMEKEDTDET